jgi:hypothetical protein
MNSWLNKFPAGKRLGGHHRQMKAQSCTSHLTGYVFCHLIPIGQGSVVSLQSLSIVLHTLKIILLSFNVTSESLVENLLAAARRSESAYRGAKIL